MRKLLVFSSMTLSCMSASVLAEQVMWQHCDINYQSDFLPYVAPDDKALVDVKADQAQLVGKGTSVFSGNVVVTRNGRELTTEHATYNRLSGTVTAQGDMRLRDSEIILEAEQAEWSMDRNEGALVNAKYRLRQNHARGKASHVFKQDVDATQLDHALYTTCAQGDNFWDLNATSVNLNHAEAVGTAKDVVVRIKEFPVFYTPYISFPLNDERKSGFLVPSIGNSDETGFDVQTPYYWNIAPGRDATITPRYMSARGIQLNGEYRYLYEQGEGELNAGFLASDDLRNDGDDINPHFNEDRKHFSFKHTSDFSSRWSNTIDYNYVSDDDYLEDFGSDLSLSSTTHLNRRFTVNYSGDNWQFLGRLQGYQTLTDAEKTYQRLPQLRVTGTLPDQAFGLSYGLSAEYVEFDHDDLVDGQRYDIMPSVSLPIQTAATFVTPRVALKHTQYQLDDNGTVIADDSPSRTLPIVSVDSGLFFERDLTFSDNSYLQTLEPRAFYLYIPERDQTDIPVFDSSIRTFNFGQLFTTDRFSGTDRIGDANQLALALTTRIIDPSSGRERFRASLGQIRYFRDREVTLPAGTVDTRSGSDYVAEVAAEIAKEWTARGEIQWSQHGPASNFSSVQVRYRGDDGRILNLSHRYRREGVSTLDGLEQVDISGRLPISKQWSMVGRYYRSIQEGELLEGLAGVEYQSCCWSSRLVVRDYINDVTDEDRNLAIMLQLELKGLGNFGQKSDSLLERSILGFDSDN